MLIVWLRMSSFTSAESALIHHQIADALDEDGNALARKLSHHAPISRAECDALDKLLGLNVRTVAAGTDVVPAGSSPSEISVILSGWACRVKRGVAGSQIVAFHLPGDVCDFNALIIGATDTSVEAIDTVRVAGISRRGLRELSARFPKVSQGLWWESLMASSVQREWVANLCQRDSGQRVAHLICEIVTRLELVGLLSNGRCRFPITQSALGNACGITPEHANRTLRRLRDQNLLILADRSLTLIDRPALEQFCRFDPAYLHLNESIHRRNEAGRQTSAQVMDSFVTA